MNLFFFFFLNLNVYHTILKEKNIFDIVSWDFCKIPSDNQLLYFKQYYNMFFLFSNITLYNECYFLISHSHSNYKSIKKKNYSKTFMPKICNYIQTPKVMWRNLYDLFSLKYWLKFKLFEIFRLKTLISSHGLTFLNSRTLYEKNYVIY